MASPLIYKLYDGKRLIASFRHAEEAAVIIALRGKGVIKWEGRIVWRENEYGQNAEDGYDFVAATVAQNIKEINIEGCKKQGLDPAAYGLT